MLGLVGALRANKGIELIAETAAAMGSDLQFLCVGAPSSYLDIEQLVGGGDVPSNLTILARPLTDGEFASFICACDGILLPYDAATTSGALMVALTLERGVIVSDLPAFTGVLASAEGAGEAGVVMKERSAEGLADAVETYLALPPSQRGGCGTSNSGSVSLARVGASVCAGADRRFSSGERWPRRVGGGSSWLRGPLVTDIEREK